METIHKYDRDTRLSVYLIVQNGETVNVFATLGLAIDCIAYNANRIAKECITSQTLTKLEWKGRDTSENVLEIKECPICKDVTLDYMDKPRSVNV